jgi:hypothetical protein
MGEESTKQSIRSKNMSVSWRIKTALYSKNHCSDVTECLNFVFTLRE